jgi:hypothetical protein
VAEIYFVHVVFTLYRRLNKKEPSPPVNNDPVYTKPNYINPVYTKPDNINSVFITEMETVSVSVQSQRYY